MDQDMSHLSSTTVQEQAQETDHSFAAREPSNYEPPKFAVISLDCEITAYAPDEGDTPLF